MGRKFLRTCGLRSREDLFNLGGVYGGKNAGDPMEYDYLKLILTDDTVEITVYNRGIALFMSDDELYTGSCANSMDRGETDGRLNGKRGEG